MDLSYNEEQRLLKESLDKFIQQEYDFENRRRYTQEQSGYSKKNWQTFADLGWLAVPFKEEVGGLAGGPVETMILMEAFGKGLVVEPWVSTVLMAGHLLENLGTETQQQTYLTALIQGELTCSVAHWEEQQGFNLARVTTTAKASNGEYVLSGSKHFVFNGATADKLIVSAALADGELALFLVDSQSAGVDINGFRTLEDGRAANIVLDQVVVDSSARLGEGSDIQQALSQCDMLATFAACAEAVGIMELLYKTTVEYAKTRKQFGVPIGKFQALQHRMVNMFILHEQSQSLLLMTALKLQEGGDEAEQAVSALKAWVGQAGRKIGQEAVQLHGGMGMTDELNVGYYFKRLTAIDALFGNVDFHLNKYATALS